VKIAFLPEFPRDRAVYAACRAGGSWVMDFVGAVGGPGTVLEAPDDAEYLAVPLGGGRWWLLSLVDGVAYEVSPGDDPDGLADFPRWLLRAITR